VIPQPPAVRVFPDLDSLSRAAADFVLSVAGGAIASGSRFCMALSGGSTPRTLYTLLASPPWNESLPWRKTHVFWADERCVPPRHRDSNYGFAFETLLSRVPLPGGNIHRIHGEEGPERAARAYEDELRGAFPEDMPRFDLVLLGVGEDGHTASLFPGDAALGETKRLALPVLLDESKHSRVTLTLPVLENARKALFLAAGLTKSRIVREIIEEGNPGALPAGLVRPAQGRLLWMLDQEAASLLRDPFR